MLHGLWRASVEPLQESPLAARQFHLYSLHPQVEGEAHQQSTGTCSKMMMRRLGQVLRGAGITLATLSFGWMPPRAAALNDLFEIKLYGRWKVEFPTTAFFGNRQALNEKWAVVSADFASEDGVQAHGSVQIFNAATGAFVRKLKAPGEPVTFGRFGSALALSGDILVVGAQGMDGNRGAAYVFNVKTGLLMRTLTVAGAAANDNLGCSAAIAGSCILLGARGYNGSRGAVYAYDLVTWASLGRLDLGANGVANDVLGSAVAAEGDLALVGAQGTGGGKGAAHLFDLQTLQLVQSYAPAALVTSDAFGQSVALSRSRVFVGAPGRTSKGGVFYNRLADGVAMQELTAFDGVTGDGFGRGIASDAGMLLVGAYGVGSGAGAAYLYEADSLTGNLVFVRKFQARDKRPPPADALFGGTLTMCGNTALIGAYYDDTQATNSGAAYLIGPLLAPMPSLAKAAARGDSAPGVPETTFNVLGDAVINAQRHVAFSSTLAGTGSGGGKDSGVWTTLGQAPGALGLAVVSRKALSPGGPLVQAAGMPFFGSLQHLIMPLTLKAGTGTPAVTTATSKLLVDFDSTGVRTELAMSGAETGVASFGPAKVLSFVETVQAQAGAQNYWANTVALTKAAGVTAVNDSGILLRNHTTKDGYREGVDTLPGSGVFYGQFTGRVALQLEHAAFSAATAGPVATNQVVVSRLVPSGQPLIMAQKGDPVPDFPVTQTFAAFLGEGSLITGDVLYRATVTGAGVTTTNNEGVWASSLAQAKHQVLRKGQTVPGTSLTVGRIIQVWGAAGLDEPVAYVLVQLKGAGVTSANDQALLHVYEGSTAAAPVVRIMIREGDSALDGGTGTIGTISRVIVDGYSGACLVLATLAGAPAGMDQALYTGRQLGITSAEAALRKPTMFLRKGWRFDGQPGRVKSISVPAGTVTAGGFGATGRPTCLSWNHTLAVTVEFENGVRQIMVGDVP